MFYKEHELQTEKGREHIRTRLFAPIIFQLKQVSLTKYVPKVSDCAYRGWDVEKLEQKICSKKKI